MGTVAKINGGVITSKLEACKRFYQDVLKFEIKFESDWYLLMNCPNNPNSEIAFLVPNHPSQTKVFQTETTGGGMWFTYEVEDVDSEYERIKNLEVAIELELKDEDWGDRHFVIIDPNGIGIDVVTHRAQGN